MRDCAESETFLPLQQSPVYAAALAALGARSRWLDLGCGQALAVERGLLRLVMRGPSWLPDASRLDRRKALRRLARWCGVTLVTPEEPARGLGLIPLVTPVHHAIWRLGPDLRARMTGKWRNQLSGAERAGVSVQPGTRATLDHLIRAEAVLRAQRRYRALPGSFTQALPTDSLRIWQWQVAGQVEAAMAFVRHGSTASYHLAWGSDLARQAGVHRFMLNHAAGALLAEGVGWLDLGTVDSEGAVGLAMFKLGTGADLKPLGSTVLVLP